MLPSGGGDGEELWTAGKWASRKKAERSLKQSAHYTILPPSGCNRARLNECDVIQELGCDQNLPDAQVVLPKHNSWLSENHK